MKELTASEQRTLTALANLYYQVVPLKLRTYCTVTSEISKAVLQTFGIEATVVPCQLWCATADQNYGIGFIGNQRRDGKWDGHAICAAGNWFIDAAISHLQVEFGIKVPPVAFAPRFAIATQAISRINCSDQTCLWWFHPPHGADTTLPHEPESLISEYASHLIAKLQAVQGQSIGDQHKSPINSAA